MRTLADTVRAQQAKAVEHVFGKQDGEAFMARLKVLDVRYRNLMEAAEPLPRLVARLKAVRHSLGLVRPPVIAQSASGRVSGSSSQTKASPQTAREARAKNAALLPK